MDRERTVRDLGTSYLLAAIGFITPVAGLHHFYLHQPIMGVLYLLTWGFCGVGTLIDLIRMPRLVENENLRARLLMGGAPYHHRALPAPSKPEKKLSDEQRILRAAQEKEGAITVALASVATGMPLDVCRKLLEKMAKEGYCERDVSEQAVDLYVFPGLRSNKPFEI